MRTACADSNPPSDPWLARPGEGEPLLVRVLGPVRVQAGRSVGRPRRTATAELIAYLALQREGATQDRLLEMLWPAQDPRRTRARLWQGVSEARRLLGPALRRQGGLYRLDWTQTAVDVDSVEAALRLPPEARPERVEQALALFQGQPLEGIDGAWAAGHLRRLTALLAALCERASRLYLDRLEPARALLAAERGLSLDELNERLTRLAMQAEQDMGLRLAVAARYETLRSLLAERLGLEPARETRLLYHRLLAQS
ncbi:MAG TPA: BTAD domain-containing putative transcriptional regulator [Gaiellaceae bacterium]